MFTELLCVQYFILACKGITLGLRQWAQYEVVCERFQLQGHAWRHSSFAQAVGNLGRVGKNCHKDSEYNAITLMHFKGNGKCLHVGPYHSCRLQPCRVPKY